MNGIASTVDDEMISVGDALPRIESIEVDDRFAVLVRWCEGPRAGRMDHVDLGPAILSHGHFARLRSDPALFRQLFVTDYGSAVAWPGGIELSAEWIDRLPRTQRSGQPLQEQTDLPF